MGKSLKIISEKPTAEASSCSSSAVNFLPASEGVLSAKQFRGRAAVITLGCAKNQVDSEVMLGVLKQSGFEVVTDVTRADVAIINTCGFLEAAVKESIDTVLDVSDLKKSGSLRKLIVAGCVVSRYKGDIRQALPEVDAFVSLDDILAIGQVAGGANQDLLGEAGRPYFLYDESMPRELSTLKHYAYVKVAEGCNRPCTFCIIPKIRGSFRSRSIASVVQEVKNLSLSGVKEFNLIAQDLTSYGRDRKAEGLSALLRALNAAGDADWIRLLYAYPIGIDEELLAVIAESERVCNYLDLPLQHSSERILKAMQRPIGGYAARPITEFIRSQQPTIALRTTFIVGFPGETEEDVRDLEDFVSQGHFHSVGVFTYSPEEGTPAATMESHISAEEKEDRRARVMAAYNQGLEKVYQGYIGQTLKAYVEGAHEDSDLLLVARSSFQAPEVDGTIILNDSEIEGLELAPGTCVQVRITETAGVDLLGTVVAIEESGKAWSEQLAAN